MELKERIAAARRAAGMTQEQLGELLGVTRQAVSKWESGQTTPDAATVAALCEKLHVSADYVLLGKEPGEGQTAAYEPPDTCPCCGRKVPAASAPECGYRCPIIRPVGPNTLSLPPAPALCRARSRRPAGEILRLHPRGCQRCHRQRCEQPVPRPAAAGTG